MTAPPRTRPPAGATGRRRPFGRAPRGGTTYRRSGLGFAAALGGVLSLALIASAVIFSIAQGTDDVAGWGMEGVYEEASLSAAAAAHNGAVQTILIGEARAVGISTDAELARVLETTQAARDELLDRTAELTTEIEADGPSSEITAATDSFRNALDEVIALVRAGSLAEARTVADADLETAYQALAGLLANERDEAVAHMALSRRDAGRLADAARFLVVLFLPLGMLLAYRRRMRNRQTRRDLEQQLEKQQAVGKAKDEFIANLSHELRTPLTGIYGFACELATHGSALDPEFATELGRLIAVESGEMRRMVDDLLTVTAAEQGRLVFSKEPVNPAADVRSALAPLALSGVRLEVRAEDAVISVDRVRLQQVIRNLVSNAQKHGGPRISVVGRVDGSRYLIEVRDDGPGVRPEVEDRLFRRFVHEGKTPLITGSVGVGLANAQLLVERMRGSISYRREFNETVFAVAFPLAASPAEAVLNGAAVR